MIYGQISVTVCAMVLYEQISVTVCTMMLYGQISVTVCTMVLYGQISVTVCVTGVGFRWRIVGDMTGWLDSSVVECLHGQRKALGSSPGRATIFHLLQMAPNIKNHCGEVVKSVCSSRKNKGNLWISPTGNSWTNLKCTGSV